MNEFAFRILEKSLWNLELAWQPICQIDMAERDMILCFKGSPNDTRPSAPQTP